MGDHHDLPFKAEYAKSNRASCKGCSGLINKDTLRLAVMVQSPMFDGKVPNWFHFQCFWKRARVTTHTDVHGFDSLRWEDQEKIKEKVASGGGSAGAGGDNGSGPYTDYAAEYAKSNKSKCRGCELNIDKGLPRISRKDYESMRAKMYGPVDLWHHVDCFNSHRDELEFTSDMQPERIKGFKLLKKEDRDAIIEVLGKGSKKRKSEVPAAASAAKKAKAESPEEKELREQNKLIWKYRDALQKEVSNEAMKILLEINGQQLQSGESKLLDLVSDCMAFGALQPCTECLGGQLVYSGAGYRCTGNLTEWTKCMHITQHPARKAFKVPKEYHDVQVLKSYKYVKRERVFPKEPAAASGSGIVSSAGDAVNMKPLLGMRFVIGKTQKAKADVQKAVQSLGGTVVSKVDKKVMAVISTKGEVDKMSKLMQKAKDADVHVIDEKFLEEVKAGGAALLVKQHSIAAWGGDPHEREGGDVVDGPTKSSAYKSGMSAKDESRFTKVPDKLKMMVKGGAAVDPESGLEEKAHVLQEKGEIYCCVLGLVDIARGTNSYYKLQCLESDKSQRWWLFRSWGRVGTTIGGTKLETCGSKNSVIERYMDLYAEKTGNQWHDRKNFTKFPNKFYPLDIDYGAEDEEVKKLDKSAGSRSKLPTEVQDLIRMIFDVESMKKAMLEFEIDLKKMPLGKLSKKQIEQAYSVLTELNKLVEEKGSPTKFLDASNRFYTLIPHDFGMKKPPMLDTPEIIKSKIEMLDNLLDIEVAYSLLKGGDDGTKDPLDVHYEKLKTEVQVVDKKSEEFDQLIKYVKNTHAATHNQYDLDVQQIFKLEREGEKKRFKPFKKLHNRQLLWHGSRITNYGGILSQGLRIAPPEAPVTGYMFGKGIYFADMVSKSANYCRTTRSDPVGIMLLCEVALGNMYELTGAKYVQNLPKGMHSTKGCGRTAPDPSATITTEDGVQIPLGTGTDADINTSSLLYNEYIIYDVAQARQKYLVQAKFNFKW